MGLFIAIVVLVWILFIGSWWFLTRWFRASDVNQMKDRLLGKDKKSKKSESDRVALFDPAQRQRGQLIPRLMKKYNLSERLRALIEQAGLKWDPVSLVQGCLAGFIAGYGIGYFMLPASMRIYAIAVGLALGALPILYVIHIRRRRLHAFEEIFPDTLEFISRSMRAGHAFSVSLEMIHREFAEPLASEFRRTFEEHNLGLPLDVALQGLSKRIPLLDVHFFVSAVLLQKRTGGNLAEILDKLAYVIRERFKLRGRIKAISAHGRMTGLALTCIPIGVAILMFFVNPEYIEFFFEDETGNIMLAAAVGFQIVGYLIIKKIVQIEV
jgi:tight adherence protein B